MTLATGGTVSTDPNGIEKALHEQIQPFRALAPPPYGGMYLNEPDILEKEWQLAQWGEQYPRLLAIKKDIDPKDLLIVRLGVNSEGWDQEIICKTIS
jgi:FAD/FMN-containing dehydrogenase